MLQWLNLNFFHSEFLQFPLLLIQKLKKIFIIKIHDIKNSCFSIKNAMGSSVQLHLACRWLWNSNSNRRWSIKQLQIPMSKRCYRMNLTVRPNSFIHPSMCSVRVSVCACVCFYPSSSYIVVQYCC